VANSAEPSELGSRSSATVSHSIFDQELLSTRATSTNEDKNEGDVFMEAIRLLENHDMLRRASKIGLRLLRASDFETELSVCLKFHAGTLKKNSRTEEQKAFANYMEFYYHSLARTVTGNLFEDSSQPLQLIQSRLGQESESASDKMRRYYQTFVSVNPEELVLSNVSRLQESNYNELAIDINTITTNEEFFLQEEAFANLLAKIENMIQKETWIDLTAALKPVSFLRTMADNLFVKIYGCYIAFFIQLEIRCRPRVRPGYRRLYWKCISLLSLN
jgi:hypothetical protein